MPDRDYELLLIEAAELGDTATAAMRRLEEIAGEFAKGDHPRRAIRAYHRIERAVKSVKAGGGNALKAARHALDRQADGPVTDAAPDPQPRLPFLDPPKDAPVAPPTEAAPLPEEWPGWGVVERLAEVGYNAERTAQVAEFLEQRWRVRLSFLPVPQEWTRSDVKRLGLTPDEIEPLATEMPYYKEDLMALLAFPRVDRATGEVLK